MLGLAALNARGSGSGSLVRGWRGRLAPYVPIVYLLVLRTAQRSSPTAGPWRHPDEAAHRRVVPHRPPGLSADAGGA